MLLFTLCWLLRFALLICVWFDPWQVMLHNSRLVDSSATGRIDPEIISLAYIIVNVVSFLVHSFVCIGRTRAGGKPILTQKQMELLARGIHFFVTLFLRLFVFNLVFGKLQHEWFPYATEGALYRDYACTLNLSVCSCPNSLNFRYLHRA